MSSCSNHSIASTGLAGQGAVAVGRFAAKARYSRSILLFGKHCCPQWCLPSRIEGTGARQAPLHHLGR